MVGGWPEEARGHRVNDRAAMTKWLIGKLRMALRFIRENIGRPFGAAEIAASLKVPRVRLDRLFAAELRRSAGKEIMRQRLAKARQLLTETDDTLDAIASSCGFCHASYLVNAFKKATGTTPRRFRLQRGKP